MTSRGFGSVFATHMELYLDDHAAEMKLVRELRMRACKQCGREEETTWAGADFFCSECRGRHRNG